jgi:hypothetical protein
MKLKYLILFMPLVAVLALGCTPRAVEMNITTPDLGAAMGGPTTLTSENAAITEMITGMIGDQGVLKDFLARARAHGLNPGLKFTRGMETYIKIGLDGIDADVSAEIQGDGTRLPAGTRDNLLDVLAALGDRTDPEANALRQAALDLLGWNRSGAGGNTNADGSGGG